MYLWCCECCGAAHGVLHNARLNIQTFKLLLKLVHDAWNLKKKNSFMTENWKGTQRTILFHVQMTLYLFQIHRLQSGVHAFHHSSHRFCDLRKKNVITQLTTKAKKCRSAACIWRQWLSIKCTCFIVTAVWTRADTASTRALILRKFTDWFFCLMAFSAWILATSIFPFWMA